MKSVSRLAVAAVAALAISSSAGAQTISFIPSGFFTGACSSFTNTTISTFGGTAGSSSCTIGTGGTITYTQPLLPQTVVGGGNVSYGQFQTSGVGSNTFSGVSFTLQVSQLSPTFGSSPDVVGAVNGTFTSAPSGGLLWTPSPTTFAIGDVNYRIAVDAGTMGIQIDPPNVNGGLGDPQTIRGSVSTTVPEPSTYALMAAGLAGLGLVARRRRNA